MFGLHTKKAEQDTQKGLLTLTSTVAGSLSLAAGSAAVAAPVGCLWSRRSRRAKIANKIYKQTFFFLFVLVKTKATRWLITADNSHKIQLQHLVSNEQMKRQCAYGKLATRLGLLTLTSTMTGSMSMATTGSTTTMATPVEWPWIPRHILWRVIINYMRIFVLMRILNAHLGMQRNENRQSRMF